MFGTPNVALVPREIDLEATRIIEVTRSKKAHAPPPNRRVGQRLGLPRSKRVKAMETKM